MVKTSKMNKSSFFWLHLKKCGGTSFRKSFSPPYVIIDRTILTPLIALKKEEYNDAINNFALPLGSYDNKRMLFVKKYLYDELEFNLMYKFTIVRNPYDRAVSAWKYLHRNDHIFSRKSIFNPKSILLKYSFESFLENLPNIFQQKGTRHYYTHTLPMLPDLTDNSGNLLIDEYFKIEEINEAIPILNERLKVNIAQFSHLKDNRKDKDYKKFYSPKTKSLVEKIYGEDIEFFKYKF